MNNNTAPIEMLFEKAEVYTKTTMELLKLQAIDKSADVVSSLAVRLAIFMVVVLFTLIINIGIALWIGELLGKSYYGFFIVAGFCVLIAILLYSFRNQWIKEPLSNSIITKLLKQKTE
jgi:phosphoglycerol transferase MdoB-like AlkP superfamily enzyme